MIAVVFTNGTTLDIDADRITRNGHELELYDTVNTDGFFPVALFNYNNIAGFISKKPVEIEEK